MPNRFFWCENVPTYSDHDFAGGYTITPCGYLVLMHPTGYQLSRCGINETVEELPLINSNFGVYRDTEPERCHIDYPNTGKLFLNFWPSEFYVASAESHYNDLIEIISSETDASDIFLITDQGPDYNCQSWLTFYHMGCLWRDTGLSSLILSGFAPHFSAYNPIERVWSHVGKNWAGTVTSATPNPDGSGTPPFANSKISPEERLRQEVLIFDRETKRMAEITEQINYMGRSITSKSIPCPKPKPTPDPNNPNPQPKTKDEALRAVLEPTTSEALKKLIDSASIADKVRSSSCEHF